METSDPTRRFSNRVDDYVRYRPLYPTALLAWLQQHLGVSASWIVADIGAGTGISSRMFLEGGHTVIAVEPNTPMRRAAEQALGSSPLFRAVDGRAEATTLPDHSVDLVSAAQAFHWFDPAAAKREWSRILRPGGLAAIYWNVRRVSGTPFLEGYEKLLFAHCPDYAAVAEKHGNETEMRSWFQDRFVAQATFEHHQEFDFAGLRGRLMSSSYAPTEVDPRHEPLMTGLKALFAETNRQGSVRFEYDTRLYVGHLPTAHIDSSED